MHASAPVILLVDDESFIREVFRTWLQRAGYRVVEAGCGSEALAHLQGGDRVDLLVTDSLMPGMDGDQLVARVRQDWPAVPIMVVSGGGMGLTGPDADVVLDKPVRGTALLAAVAGLLDRS